MNQTSNCPLGTANVVPAGEKTLADSLSPTSRPRKARTPAKEVADVQKEFGILERHIADLNRSTDQQMLYNRCRASCRQLTETLDQWAKEVEPF